VSLSAFVNNSATGVEGHGGAIAWKGALSVGTCTFTGNSATQFGGAVCADTTAVLQVYSSVFDSNTAGEAGGSIRAVSTVLPLISGTFTGSSASCCYAAGAAAAAAATATTAANLTAAGFSCADVDSSSATGDECCSTDYYIDSGRCVLCSAELGCDTVGTNAATLQLAPGLWRLD
jgi:predicted outer membrane repeat protein